MELQKDALIVTNDGREIGHLDRVAINPRSKEVTHLVVRKGLLFPVDKVIEMSYVAAVTPERITLSAKAGDPEYLPPFEVKHFVNTSDRTSARGGLGRSYAPQGYWYSPGGGAGFGVPVRGIPDAPLPTPGLPRAGEALQVEQNIPETTVALKEGARVVAEDGEMVGQIVRVFTDETTDRATRFLVAHGGRSSAHKAIPADWIGEITEKEVHLLVGSDVMAEVPNYEAGA